MFKQVGHTNKDSGAAGHLLPWPLKGSAVCATVSISGKGQHIAKAISLESKEFSFPSALVCSKNSPSLSCFTLTTDILLTVLILPDVDTPVYHQPNVHKPPLA